MSYVGRSMVSKIPIKSVAQSDGGYMNQVDADPWRTEIKGKTKATQFRDAQPKKSTCVVYWRGSFARKFGEAVKEGYSLRDIVLAHPAFTTLYADKVEAMYITIRRLLEMDAIKAEGDVKLKPVTKGVTPEVKVAKDAQAGDDKVE